MRIVFKPYPVLSIFSFATLILLFSLGMWQLRRHQWKVGVLSQLAIAEKADYYTLAELRDRVRHGKRIDYLPVSFEKKCKQNKIEYNPILIYQSASGQGISWRVLDWVSFQPQIDSIVGEEKKEADEGKQVEPSSRIDRKRSKAKAYSSGEKRVLLVDYGRIPEAIRKKESAFLSAHVGEPSKSGGSKTVFRQSEVLPGSVKNQIENLCGTLLKGRVWPYRSVGKLTPKGDSKDRLWYAANLSYFAAGKYQFPAPVSSIFPYYIKLDDNIFSDSLSVDRETVDTEKSRITLGKKIPDRYNSIPKPHNRHLGYAINWFSFLLILLGFYGAYHYKRGRLYVKRKPKKEL